METPTWSPFFPVNDVCFTSSFNSHFTLTESPKLRQGFYITNTERVATRTNQNPINVHVEKLDGELLPAFPRAGHGNIKSMLKSYTIYILIDWSHSHCVRTLKTKGPKRANQSNSTFAKARTLPTREGNFQILFLSMARIEEVGPETPVTPPASSSSPPSSSSSPPSSFMFLLRIMSKRRTWACIFVLVYGVLLFFSWNFLKLMLSWYNLEAESSSSGWPAIYASVLLGVVFGMLSMVAALAVMVPAVLVTWIAVVVLLAFFGKPRKDLVVEGRKITREIFSFVIRVLLKEGNVVAALCAVLGYFALIRGNSD